MAHIFMTGSTGFIGMYALKELAISKENHTINALVRSNAKWEQVCKQMGLGREYAGRINPIIGDLSAPHLGLSASNRALVQTADVIIHAGGPMDILLGEDEARTVFLQAAEEMLGIAEEIHKRKGLRHFIHLVGFKSPFNDDNILSPDSIIAHLEQEPPYERMKFFADLRIRQSAKQAGFPLSVIHPSVVIGSSEHGETVQTGGLGILVKSAARKMMGIVPGGSSHWLPLVHVDHVAAFISALACEALPVNGTYYLLDEKNDSPSMTKLVTGITKELRVGKPVGSISPRVLSKVLGSSIGRKLGIPKESLDFIVKADQAYPLAAAREIQHRYCLAHTVNASIMPATIADLDFRLVHSQVDTDGFMRGKRGPLATLERNGTRYYGSLNEAASEMRSVMDRADDGALNKKQEGSIAAANTIVFVHGTLSSADCLLPLAEQFPESTVCLVDLPGFGRSPYHHGRNVLEGHIESLVEAIRSFDTPVTLVGHSLGGLLAAHAYACVPERIRRLHLLQPVLHRAPKMYRSAFLTEAALRRLSAPGLKKQLMAQSCFTDISDIPPGYVTYVLQELQSPRVRKTTAETLSALTRAESFRLSQDVSLRKDGVTILWGTQDRVYRQPESFRSVRTLEIPAAHNFPISHPVETAEYLQQLGL
ncbi:Alpha/beta hydrolase family protein [Paenibacillus uliginis N3/975]|uniref:Alpha/beta hydrolase family protein n=1 Tax=Paenibacillus uliginis N3/975 TaxID=1313296 RepID=A0A1X7HGI0_9BACL|nr:alpha/beta fold hydrolase [Paenibacillus uliginis]SMF85937.1 Alpha/beta hydrolase family protein [Paenibacillus uliginis N3/975]